MPGPAVDDAHDQARPDRAGAHRDRLPAAVGDRVLHQVGERALQLDGIGAQRRQVAVELEGDELRAVRCAQGVARGGEDLGEVDPVELRRGLAGLQPREVQAA